MMTQPKETAPEEAVFPAGSPAPAAEAGTTAEVDVRALVAEYCLRSTRKNDDEKWLKEKKPIVIANAVGGKFGLKQLGDYQISYTQPDASNVDPEKLRELMISTGHLNDTVGVTYTPDEVVSIVSALVELMHKDIEGDETEAVFEVLHGQGAWVVNEEAIGALIEVDADLKTRVTNECFIKGFGAPRLQIKKKGKE